MSLRKVLWVFVTFGSLFMFLWFLRFLGVVGSTIDILIRWLAIIDLILFGISIGFAAEERKINAKGIVVNLLLALTVVFLSPMIGITTALGIGNILSLNFQAVIIMSATVSGFFGLLFILFVYWLRRKGHL